MNRGQLRDEARVIISEVTKSASFADDSDLNYFINQGLRDICINGLVYEKKETISVVAGTESYSLSSDWVKTAIVIDPNGVALTPIHPSDVGRYYSPYGTTNVTPAYWYCWGDLIYLKPTAAGTGAGNFTHMYYAIDSDLSSDTSSPNIPDKWHRLISVYAAYRYYLKARQLDVAAFVINEYVTSLNLAIERYVSRFPQEYRVSGVLPKVSSIGVQSSQSGQ